MKNGGVWFGNFGDFTRNGNGGLVCLLGLLSGQMEWKGSRRAGLCLRSSEEVMRLLWAERNHARDGEGRCGRVTRWVAATGRAVE